MDKLSLVFSFLILLGSQVSVAAVSGVNEPDSVYLFSYATSKNNNTNGLHFAWSTSRTDWQAIGNEHSFLKSDYGTWGAEKRMLSPFLVKQNDGSWKCLFSVNERDNVVGSATSKDLVHWKPQQYLKPGTGANSNSPEQYQDRNVSLDLGGAKLNGQIHRVEWKLVDQLIKTYELRKYQQTLSDETTAQDAQRFAGLKPINASLKVFPQKSKAISNMLTGVFFEDINYAADGGLYAELIQNRDFEYVLSDKKGNDINWNSKYSWSYSGTADNFSIDSVSPLHLNNPHYAVLTGSNGELKNSGYDGIALVKGATYDFSVFSRKLKGEITKLWVGLKDKDGKILAQKYLSIKPGGWKKYSTQLSSMADVKDARLVVKPVGSGEIALDMISLFPQKTFKGRKNGLREDLAQTIADIHPRFMRFPGGCVAHGDGLENIYRWKNTIGPLESRKPQRNIWNYHQTAGLGYFEYFQFCEDMGAAALPIIAAGVPCQNSSTGGAGQQGGIPMEEMDAYIQDIFDLVEWANGDVHSKWGSKRAAAGHPKPFNLKYIGIGNEDLISDIFEERFTMIFNAMKLKHPEITVIGTVGPNAEGSDYDQGWEIASKLKVPVVDEHYYQQAGWFIHHQDYYDRYDRSKSKVYLGEYAAFLAGRPNNIETALAEALYMTSLERNGDVVSMASYAPMLAKEGHTQWNPDLIYFTNTEVKPTVGYEVQKLYGTHAGDTYLPAQIDIDNPAEAVKKRIAYSIVKDTKQKDLFIKIVNLLPVKVNTKLELSGVKLQSPNGHKSVLQGSPDDKKAKTSQSAFVFTDQSSLELPPYSFTVIRLKTN